MFDASANIVHRYPGGIIAVAGAKKKIPAQFDRFWQEPVPYPSKKCQFHDEGERAGALMTAVDSEGEKWFVMDSKFAPDKVHRLIIPDNCWDDETMRHLGGLTKIKMAMQLAMKQFAQEADQGKLWCFSIQIGPLAAQNVPHCHYHLYQPNLYDDELVRLEEARAKTIILADVKPNGEVVVFENPSFTVVAGGQFTGQLFMLPTFHLHCDDAHTPDALAYLIDKIVVMYAEAFRSTQGLGPDYRWEFQIHNGEVKHGFFIPKLNNTGTLEDAAMMDRRVGMNLLWSHEETASHLRTK